MFSALYAVQDKIDNNENKDNVSQNQLKDEHATLISAVPEEWENVVQNYVHWEEALLPKFSLCTEYNKYVFYVQ